MTTPWMVIVSVLCGYSLLLGVLVLGLFRRVVSVLDRTEARLRGPVHVQPPGLAPGSVVPPFEGYDAAGERFDHQKLLGRRSLVVFLSPDCRPCHALAAEFAAAGDALAGDILAVVSDSAEGREFAAQLSVQVVFQPDHEIAHAFGTDATPHVFAIDERGVVVTSGTANDAEGLRDLAASLTEGR